MKKKNTKKKISDYNLVNLFLKNEKELQELLNKIEVEYQYGYNSVESKREMFRRRLKSYVNVYNNDNKVYVRYMMSVIDTMMGLYYKDVASITFAGRKTEAEDIAYNINNLQKFDFQEMEISKMNYKIQWDKLFYGVGIRVNIGWDKERKIPIYKVIDPLNWIPDPEGYINSHRFHGFELETTLEALKASGYSNLDKICGGPTNNIEINKNAYKQNRNISMTEIQEEDSNINIYYHYTIFKGKKYFVCLGNERTLPIYIQEIEPINKAEEKDVNLIKYPVILNFWKPIRYDPFGISIPDILEDKQSALQLFLNLERIKAEHEAWGDIFLYDPDVIKNPEAMKIPTLGPKYVKADLKINANPLYPVPRGNIKQDVYNISNIISSQAQTDIGLDNQSLGVGGQKYLTATENQRIAENANIKMLLGTKVNQWGEEDFWNNWYRNYKLFFSWNDEKNIRLNNTLGNIVYMVKKPDIISEEDIDVIVANASEIEVILEKQRISLVAMLTQIIQNPEIKGYSKNYALRKLLEINGMPKEETFYIVPESVDEMKAKEDIILLNRNEAIRLEDDAMTQDHLTYIMIYRKAYPTSARNRAILQRQQLLIMSGQDKQGLNQLPGGMIPGEQQGREMSRSLQNNIVNQLMTQDMNSNTGQTATSLASLNQ